MGRIKILVIGADDNPGGVSGYVNELISFCNKDHYEFHMTVSKNKLDGSIINNTVVRHIFPIKYSIFSLFQRLVYLRGLIRQHGISILHLHTARAGFIGCFASIGLAVPIIYTGHSWRYTQKTNWIQRKLFFYYEKFICYRANIVTFLTEDDKQFGTKNKLVKERKCAVITTRIDASKFKNNQIGAVNALREQLNIPIDALVIGSTGYLSERKDPLTFVRVASKILQKVPNALFLWVGDGELKEKATQLSRKLGIHGKVIFSGMVSPDQVPLYLKIMSVFLFTSHNEGVPLSIMEAQATGLPIVCSNYKGSAIEELIIHNQTGYIFPRSDEETASKYILAILENTDKTQHLVEAMQDRFRNTHAEPKIMAQQYEDIYSSLKDSGRYPENL